MNDKHKIVADIIITLVQEGKYHVNDLVLSRKPDGFWSTVRLMLPSNMSWSNDPQYYVNIWPKIKEYVQDEINQRPKRITPPTQMPILEQIETPLQSAPIPCDPVVIQTDAITRLELVHIINEILDSRIQDLKSALPVSTSTLKQVPEGDTGKPVPFATCTKPRLKELFMDECKRLKLSQAGLLSAILYTYFNEPSLK